MTPDTTELSQKRRDKARELIEQLSSDHEFNNPRDLVDMWEPMPPAEWTGSEKKTFVKPEKIRGVTTGNINRLKPSRLKNQLQLLVNGDYIKKPENSPHLNEINGSYYVDEDGIHRSLAHKILGIEKMWARVAPFKRKS